MSLWVCQRLSTSLRQSRPLPLTPQRTRRPILSQQLRLSTVALVRPHHLHPTQRMCMAGHHRSRSVIPSPPQCGRPRQPPSCFTPPCPPQSLFQPLLTTPSRFQRRSTTLCLSQLLLTTPSKFQPLLTTLSRFPLRSTGLRILRRQPPPQPRSGKRPLSRRRSSAQQRSPVEPPYSPLNIELSRVATQSSRGRHRTSQRRSGQLFLVRSLRFLDQRASLHSQ